MKETREQAIRCDCMIFVSCVVLLILFGIYLRIIDRFPLLTPWGLAGYVAASASGLCVAYLVYRTRFFISWFALCAFTIVHFALGELYHNMDYAWLPSLVILTTTFFLINKSLQSEKWNVLYILIKFYSFPYFFILVLVWILVLLFYFLPVCDHFAKMHWLYNCAVILLTASLAGFMLPTPKTVKKLYAVALPVLLLWVLLTLTLSAGKLDIVLKSPRLPGTHNTPSEFALVMAHSGWTGIPPIEDQGTDFQYFRKIFPREHPRYYIMQEIAWSVQTAESICVETGWIGLFSVLTILATMSTAALSIARMQTSRMRYATAALAFYILTKTILYVFDLFGLVFFFWNGDLPFLSNMDFCGWIPYFGLGWIMKMLKTISPEA